MDDIMMSDFLGPLDTDVEFEHDYPRIPTTTALSGPTKLVWALDFTNGGRFSENPSVRTRGVIPLRIIGPPCLRV
jgi:hypothetical protein